MTFKAQLLKMKIGEAVTKTKCYPTTQSFSDISKLKKKLLNNVSGSLSHLEMSRKAFKMYSHVDTCGDLVLVCVTVIKID